MSYFAIATPEGDQSGISTDRMKGEVLRRWPTAQIEFPQDGLYSLRWETRPPDEWIEGGLYRDGFTLDLDGPLERCAELAVWMKAELKCEVVFTDHLSEGCVVVSEHNPASELVEAYQREAQESSK